MSGTDGFGLPKDEPTDAVDPFADSPEAETEDDETVEQTTTEVEVETDAPETALDEVAAEVEVEAEADEEIVPEPKGTALPRQFLNKYGTLEEAEEAFNELRRTERRAAEAERKLSEQNKQYEEYLRVAAQELQRRQDAPAQPTATEIEQQAAQYGVDPETYQAAQRIAAEQVQQQMAPYQQQLTAQQQQQAQQAQHQQELEKVRQVASAWVTDQGDSLDDQTWTNVVQVFGELELDEHLSENYDMAREIAADPALRATLRAMPDLVESDDGMALARRLASDASDTQPTPTRKPKPNAHVERGGSGATPAGDAPKLDAWGEVLKSAEADKTKSSVLGV